MNRKMRSIVNASHKRNKSYGGYSGNFEYLGAYAGNWKIPDWYEEWINRTIESFQKKEIKRVYSDNDPFGEEVWD